MRISDWSSEVCSSDLVIYVVRNIGSVAATAPWTDRIYIDSDDNIASARTLTSLPRNFDLAPGESYEVTQAVTIPSSYADGDWRIFVRADALSQVFENGLETDNVGVSGILKLTHPDLKSEEHTSELQSLMRTSY